MSLLDYKNFLLLEAVDKTSYTLYVSDAIEKVKNDNLKTLFDWVKNNTPAETFAVDAIGISAGEFKKKQLTIKASYDSNVSPLVNAIKGMDFAKVVKSSGGGGRGGFTTIEVTYPDSKEVDTIKLINSSKRLGSSAPSTQIQEMISMIVFSYFVEKGISDIGTILPELEEIWPEIESNQEWLNSFQQQGNCIKSYLSGHSGYTYYLREGFPSSLYALAKEAGFSKPDSWDPADVWMVKNVKTHEAAITKLWKENSNIAAINDYLRSQLKTKEIIPISLKKTAKTASLAEVNVQEQIKSGTLDITNIYCDLNIKTDKNGRHSFDNNGARMDFNDGSVFSARMFTASSFGVEGIPPRGTSGGRLGKVPKNIVEDKLKDTRFVFSEWKKSFDQHGDLGKMFDTLQKSTLVDTRAKELPKDSFMQSMKEAFDNLDTRENIYTQKCLGMLVTYHIANMSVEERKNIANTFYYSSQKSGEDFGPHIKIY